MERYTEYTIAHDGVPVEKLPPMRDHDTAVRRLKVDRSIYPDKEVTLIHRSVTCGDWALTIHNREEESNGQTLGSEQG